MSQEMSLVVKRVTSQRWARYKCQVLKCSKCHLKYQKHQYQAKKYKKKIINKSITKMIIKKINKIKKILIMTNKDR